MIKTLYIWTVLVLLTSCNNSTETVQTKLLTLSDLKKDFKFSNLKEFEIDTFSWETRPGKYIELDSSTFYMVWQDGKRNFVGQGYDRDYLFAWQDRDPNFIEFTILTQDESDYCNNITYCIYDKEGKSIDKFVASSSCGDGDWVFESFGKFIDKHTYEKLCIESELTEFDTLENKELYEGDSTLYHFIIDRNGKVIKKEIYKRHFRQLL